MAPELPLLQMYTWELSQPSATAHWTQWRLGIVCQLQMHAQPDDDAVIGSSEEGTTSWSLFNKLIQTETFEALHIKSSYQGQIISSSCQRNSSTDRQTFFLDKQLSHEANCIMWLLPKGAGGALNAGEQIYVFRIYVFRISQLLTFLWNHICNHFIITIMLN